MLPAQRARRLQAYRGGVPDDDGSGSAETQRGSPAFRHLRRDLRGCTATLDAIHVRRDTARCLAGVRSGDDFVAVCEGQPGVRAATANAEAIRLPGSLEQRRCATLHISGPEWNGDAWFRWAGRPAGPMPKIFMLSSDASGTSKTACPAACRLRLAGNGMFGYMFRTCQPGRSWRNW